MSLLSSKLTASALVLAMGLSGCASLPRASNPAAIPSVAPLPAQFTSVVQSATTSNDPVLVALLTQLDVNSTDMAIGEQRLIEARARLGVARSGLLPTLSANAQASSQGAEGASNTNAGGVGASLQVPLDFFGAAGARRDSAAARVEEARFNQQRIIALTRATLTDLYVVLRTAQAQVEVTNANLARAEDSLSLARTRQTAGLETGLGVAQATSNRDAIAARLPAFQQGVVAARLGIEALIGQAPATWETRLAQVQTIPRFDVSKTNIPPSQWLSGRPDLAAGQARLQAAGLDARAAARDRYPNVSLSALLNQSESDQGFTGASGGVALNLVSTLFDFGRLDGLAKVASATAMIEAQTFRQLVLNAAAQVETEASRVNQGNRAIAANAANVASAQDQANLAQVRYTSGLSSFLDVLTAQRAVFEAQSEFVRATGDTASGEVALNLALGL